jgi:hypothetical protein
MRQLPHRSTRRLQIRDNHVGEATVCRSNVQTVEMSFDRAVALARCRLQALTVEDGDAAVRVFDQPAFCNVPATTVTVGRVEPSIIARNS